MKYKGVEYVRVNTLDIDSTKKIIKGMKIPYRIFRKAVPNSMLLSKRTFTIQKQLYIPKIYEQKLKNCIV